MGMQEHNIASYELLMLIHIACPSSKSMLSRLVDGDRESAQFFYSFALAFHPKAFHPKCVIRVRCPIGIHCRSAVLFFPLGCTADRRCCFSHRGALQIGGAVLPIGVHLCTRSPA